VPPKPYAEPLLRSLAVPVEQSYRVTDH
jgi:hypothetical protein